DRGNILTNGFESFADERQIQSVTERRAEAANDRFRSVPGQEQSLPSRDLEIEALLARGRHIGKDGRTAGSGGGVRLDVAGLNLRPRRRGRIAHVIDSTSDQVLHGGS